MSDGFNYTVKDGDKGLTYIFLDKAKKDGFQGDAKGIDWNKVMSVFDEIQNEKQKNKDESLFSGGNNKTKKGWGKSYVIHKKDAINVTDEHLNKIYDAMGFKKEPEKKVEVAPPVVEDTPKVEPESKPVEVSSEPEPKPTQEPVKKGVETAEERQERLWNTVTGRNNKKSSNQSSETPEERQDRLWTTVTGRKPIKNSEPKTAPASVEPAQVPTKSAQESTVCEDLPTVSKDAPAEASVPAPSPTNESSVAVPQPPTTAPATAEQPAVVPEKAVVPNSVPANAPAASEPQIPTPVVPTPEPTTQTRSETSSSVTTTTTVTEYPASTLIPVPSPIPQFPPVIDQIEMIKQDIANTELPSLFGPSSPAEVGPKVAPAPAPASTPSVESNAPNKNIHTTEPAEAQKYFQQRLFNDATQLWSIRGITGKDLYQLQLKANGIASNLSINSVIYSDLLAKEKSGSKLSDEEKRFLQKHLEELQQYGLKLDKDNKIIEIPKD